MCTTRDQFKKTKKMTILNQICIHLSQEKLYEDGHMTHWHTDIWHLQFSPKKKLPRFFITGSTTPRIRGVASVWILCSQERNSSMDQGKKLNPLNISTLIVWIGYKIMHVDGKKWQNVVEKYTCNQFYENIVQIEEWSTRLDPNSQLLCTVFPRTQLPCLLWILVECR